MQILLFPFVIWFKIQLFNNIYSCSLLISIHLNSISCLSLSLSPPPLPKPLMPMISVITSEQCLLEQWCSPEPASQPSSWISYGFVSGRLNSLHFRPYFPEQEHYFDLLASAPRRADSVESADPTSSDCPSLTPFVPFFCAPGSSLVLALGKPFSPVRCFP